jgi:hypothetical protein
MGASMYIVKVKCFGDIIIIFVNQIARVSYPNRSKLKPKTVKMKYFRCVWMSFLKLSNGIKFWSGFLKLDMHGKTTWLQ